MRSFAKKLTAVSMWGVLFCTAAFAEKADQQSDCGSDRGASLHPSGGIGQTFKPSQAELVGVDVWMASSVAGSDPVTVTLRENGFGGTAVASASRMVTTPDANTAMYYRFTFDSPVTVTPEATYMLEIAGDPLADLGLVWGSCGYERGEAWYNGVVLYPADDFAFRVFGTCGNGTVDAGEICDDGTFEIPCCQFPTCTPAGEETVCSFDSNPCTDDHCDGAGACSADPSPAGGTCAQDSEACNLEECDGAGACVTSTSDAPAGTPCRGGDASLCTQDICDGAGVCVPHDGFAAECRPAPKSSLSVSDSATDGNDKVKFKWTRSHPGLEAINLQTLALCVYDGDDLIAEASVPPGIEGWKFGSSKSSYKNSDGNVTKVTHSAGNFGTSTTFHSISMSLGGDMFSVNMSDTLTGTVRAQVRMEAGSCWGATFEPGDIKKNAGGKFVASQKL